MYANIIDVPIDIQRNKSLGFPSDRPVHFQPDIIHFSPQCKGGKLLFK